MARIPMMKYREPMTQLLSRLIAIPSVEGTPLNNMPYGQDVFHALMTFLDRAEKLDLETANLYGHMGCVSYGEGEETLGILCHLDVVPAGEGWDTDPFKAEVKDGRIYGRGAVDDKGPAVAALYALHAVKQSSIALHKKVCLYLGCNEETRWGDIDFFKENYKDIDYVISPDANFPIVNREKGVLFLDLSAPAGVTDAPFAVLECKSGERANVVPNKAEALLNAPAEEVLSYIARFQKKMPVSVTAEDENGCARIRVLGKASHGAHPENGINALTWLLWLLAQLPIPEGRTENFIRALSRKIGLDVFGETLGIAARDEKSGPLTCNLGAVCADGNGLIAKVDIRYPISADGEAILAKVREIFGAEGAEVTESHAMVPHEVDENSEFLQALARVYEANFDEPARFVCSCGATYARAFKNSVAFGPVKEGSPALEHQPNEYIEIDAMVKLAETIADVILEVAADEKDRENLFNY